MTKRLTISPSFMLSGGDREFARNSSHIRTCTTLPHIQHPSDRGGFMPNSL
ncbi:MAG: hypothetical protein SW833_28710 [Cyanobacteriota bacterium]|nr:hypothetical protein [Cyanobacteriota bacterium]